MKKRLRKKLRRGEFQEFGFLVQFELDPASSPSALDAFLDDFIINAMEANDLGFGGSAGIKWDGVVSRLSRGSAGQPDRDLVRSWLSSRPEVRNIDIGELKDVWYGDW